MVSLVGFLYLKTTVGHRQDGVVFNLGVKKGDPSGAPYQFHAWLEIGKEELFDLEPHAGYQVCLRVDLTGAQLDLEKLDCRYMKK